MPQGALHLVTPVLESAELNKQLGKQMYLKMECFQPVGSFKIRGIGAFCQHLIAEGAQHLIASSGGNAGYAAAYAGRKLDVPVTVVVPDTTSGTAQQRIASEGAEIIVHGSVWDEADAHARQLAADDSVGYVHPFDETAIWDGHATLIDELVQQIAKPDVVVVAVGGAGLMVGVVEGLHRNRWGDVPVLAVETEGAASFAASVQAGRLVRLDNITSIAKTLGALQVTAKALAWSQQHPIQPVVVSDAAAVNACLRFADDFRTIVEPACGAALSLMYDNQQRLDEYQRVLMVVCGGAGVSLQQLLSWQEMDKEVE